MTKQEGTIMIGKNEGEKGELEMRGRPNSKNLGTNTS